MPPAGANRRGKKLAPGKEQFAVGFAGEYESHLLEPQNQNSRRRCKQRRGCCGRMTRTAGLFGLDAPKFDSGLSGPSSYKAQSCWRTLDQVPEKINNYFQKSFPNISVDGFWEL
jgi:hypothetical protein